LVFRPDQFVIEKWLQLKVMAKISDRLLYLNLCPERVKSLITFVKMKLPNFVSKLN